MCLNIRVYNGSTVLSSSMAVMYSILQYQIGRFRVYIPLIDYSVDIPLIFPFGSISSRTNVFCVAPYISDVV